MRKLWLGIAACLLLAASTSFADCYRMTPINAGPRYSSLTKALPKQSLAVCISYESKGFGAGYDVFHLVPEGADDVAKFYTTGSDVCRYAPLCEIWGLDAADVLGKRTPLIPEGNLISKMTTMDNRGIETGVLEILDAKFEIRTCIREVLFEGLECW